MQYVLTGISHYIQIEVFPIVVSDCIYHLLNGHGFKPFPHAVTNGTVFLYHIIGGIYVLLVFQLESRACQIILCHVVSGRDVLFPLLVYNPYLYIICAVSPLLVSVHLCFECSHNLCRTIVELLSANIPLFCCKCCKKEVHPVMEWT